MGAIGVSIDKQDKSTPCASNTPKTPFLFLKTSIFVLFITKIMKNKLST